MGLSEMNSAHLRQMKKSNVQDALRKDHGGPGSDYGSDYEQRRWLRAHARKRNQTLKQFCKLEVPGGNSRAFVENYEKIDWRS